MDVAKIRKKLKEIAGKKPVEEPLREEGKEVPQSADTKTEVMHEAETPMQAVQYEIPVVHEPPAAEAGTNTDTGEEREMEVLAFKVADEEYAVTTSEIQEIIRYQNITLVPRSPKYLKGVTSIRGKILPVIDLKERLGLRHSNTGKEKIIILKTSKEPIGTLVGSVIDVVRFHRAELMQPPPTLSEKEKGLIDGVVRIKDRFISVLNVGELIK
ncbi:MAG: purine-binding chemotaxis protein CheW [Nitrospirae bacterium]|nr:purine-binding chemotaxis protein CheW [Nitrospirota bacterium]